MRDVLIALPRLPMVYPPARRRLRRVSLECRNSPILGTHFCFLPLSDVPPTRGFPRGLPERRDMPQFPPTNNSGWLITPTRSWVACFVLSKATYGLRAVPRRPARGSIERSRNINVPSSKGGFKAGKVCLDLKPKLRAWVQRLKLKFDRNAFKRCVLLRELFICYCILPSQSNDSIRYVPVLVVAGRLLS